MANAVHISLNVSDLDRSVDFYRRFFGEPRKLAGDYAKFVAADPEIHLALMPGRRDSGEGALSHLGIRVDTFDVVRSWRRTLVANGLPAGEEKREDCCYALQDKFWVSDPDGNRWEVYNVIEDRGESEAGAACTPATCCVR
jgi:catechol 2,3-dioxygenase-like lactoylglutathione lyase family enzyme